MWAQLNPVSTVDTGGPFVRVVPLAGGSKYDIYHGGHGLVASVQVDYSCGAKLLFPPVEKTDEVVIRGYNGEIAGRLFYANGKVEFEGDESESAHSLFKMLQSYVDADKR